MHSSNLVTAALLAGAVLSPSFAFADSPATDPVMEAIFSYADHAAAAGPVEALSPRSFNPTWYSLVPVPTDGVESSMIYGDASRAGPELMQGLWWMDGNPLPDEVLSFGSSTWDPVRRSANVVVYGAGVWTWHDDLAGRALWTAVRVRELVYEVAFDETLTTAVATPIVSVGPFRVRIPNDVVKFSARRVDDGVWLRESYLDGKLVHTYTLRRIVNGKGEREPAYADYVRLWPGGSLIAKRIW